MDENKPEEAAPLPSIEASRGWFPIPQAKLDSWDPENEMQWKTHGGERIATRNLIASTANLFCAFGVWLSWSVIAVKMQQMHDVDPNVYAFKDWGSPMGAEYKSLIATIPAVAGLSGGIMRICNSFIIQVSGGRTVVYSNSVLLMVPMIFAAAALKDPHVNYLTLLACAIISGIGGGMFASSMSNMSFLYPKAQQGYSLGINGGLGNLGVSMTQLLLPIMMSWGAGSEALSGLVSGWPSHAGWFWWPICLVSAIAGYLWMSDQPEHANHGGGIHDTIWGHIYFYWVEFTGLVCAAVATVVLITTRDLFFFKTPGGQVAQRFILVALSVALEHAVLKYTSPKPVKESMKAQFRMFEDKHTYIMTWLYTMSFGSFIGFSGAFPKLIQDLFGYIRVPGCTIDEIFYEGGTPEHCQALEGVWGEEEFTNPDAPDVFRYAWLGACIGSLIRPIGGIMADRYGGANVTQMLIIWCVIATICCGVIVQRVYSDPNPNDLFVWFVFMFANLFFTVGAMNGTTFRTIGVLFDKELAGPVLGWSSAIASFGAFIIPSMFNVALNAGVAQYVMYGLAAYYASCGVLNYWYYLSPGCEKPGV